MNRLDEVKKKHPKVDWDLWKTADPSNNNKYLAWLGQNIVKGKKPEQYKVLIQNFEKNSSKLEKKDIREYTFESLTETLKALAPSKKEAKEAGATTIYDKDGAKIVLLEGEQAVKQYCANTHWCISDFNTFLDYCVGSNVFVIIKNNIKYCTVVGSRQTISSIDVYDQDDEEYYIDGENNFLFKFLGLKNNILNELLQECVNYTRKNKNVWWEGGDFKITIDNFSKFNNLYTDKKSLVEKFLLDREYPEAIKFLKLVKKNNLQSIITVLSNKNIRWNDKFYDDEDAKRKSIYIMWKEINSNKPKSDPMKKTLMAIKKAGGIEKLLSSKKNVRQVIDNAMKG